MFRNSSFVIIEREEICEQLHVRCSSFNKSNTQRQQKICDLQFERIKQDANISQICEKTSRRIDVFDLFTLFSRNDDVLDFEIYFE